MSLLPRIRQAVIAARAVEPVAERLRSHLSLGEPFHDPAVAHFSLRNAVFALGDTFLEVVSPLRPDAPAAAHLERRGGDCGYMVMFQVEDLAAARKRAAELGIREVFAIELEDMAEVHLHPTDMPGAIVSLSTPWPSRSWRWGGPGWERRSASLRLHGVTIAVRDPAAVAARWTRVIGPVQGVRFVSDPAEPGLTAIVLAGKAARTAIDLAGKAARTAIDLGAIHVDVVDL